MTGFEIFLLIYGIGFVVTLITARILVGTSDVSWRRVDRIFALVFAIIWPLGLPCMIMIMVEDSNWWASLKRYRKTKLVPKWKAYWEKEVKL